MMLSFLLSRFLVRPDLSTWLPKASFKGLALVHASGLRTLSPQNVIIKYADDTTLLVAQHSSIDIDKEYNNVHSWSTQNKLSINTNKTEEIIFHRPAARNLIIPPPLRRIESVEQATLLGIDVTDTLSTDAYAS